MPPPRQCSSPAGNQRLVAYVVRVGGGELSVRKLRKELIALLPPHMIPTTYVFLDAIPRTSNNRVSRSALPQPGMGRPDIGTPLEAPRNDAQRRLCSLWAEILGVDRVGVNDDFFLLGGDSLLAMTMVMQVEESFHRIVPFAFYNDPTIARLGELWESEERTGDRREAASGESPITVIPPSAVNPGKPRRWKKTTDYKKQYLYRPAQFGFGSITLPIYFLRFAAEYLTLFFNYPQGLRWLSAWCRRPWVVDHFYPAEAKLFRHWVDSLGGCPAAPAEALNINLLSSILWSRKFQARIPFRSEENFEKALQRSSSPFFRDAGRIIASGTSDVFKHFFTVEGLENVTPPLRQGKGLILVTYHGMSHRFSTPALSHYMHVAPFPTLSAGYAWKMDQKERSAPERRKSQAALIANATVEAQRELQRGGIIQIIPDFGYDAADGLPVNIAAHRYLIKPGFAQLALLSDAVVVPLYTTRRIDGCLLTHFDPPFDNGEDKPDFPAKIEHLLNQYGAFVERSWQAAPKSIHVQNIDSHLHRPSAEA